MADAQPRHDRCVGLVLTGGGARAAYQVGVLHGIERIRHECVATGSSTPFKVMTGTSAGAINAAALASEADDYPRAVQRLHRIWHDFRASEVYRADAFGVVRSGARWLTMFTVGWALARWHRAKPRSLLDNAPLAQLLAERVAMERIPGLVRDGVLRAFAVSASSYSSGTHVTFFDAGPHQKPWARSQRIAVRDRITTTHLLASSAIPFVFPAQPLGLDGQPQWFGDGSMRQTAPISPAIHLGADRVLVIGAGRLHEPPSIRRDAGGYPTLAQIGGHAMSNIFLDALAVDIERARRINATLSLLPPDLRSQSALRPVDMLVIAPSQRIDDIAARHIGELPRPVRTMLGAVGVSRRAGREQGTAAGGGVLASYLLFEAAFTRELLALGEADALARRDEVQAFFGWPARAPTPLPDAPAA
ncbi:MAG: patatin-like phospholipase family protein [Lysobacteraceae bacterium]|jgi:NTE family protein|nr:patatin-like phospholipase family protein [Xanthomonadaceae bacterium]MCZ8319838.1 patatin-like phospholipase family protein [Silanimonas sp.]